MIKKMLANILFLLFTLTIGYFIGVPLGEAHVWNIFVAVPYSIFSVALWFTFLGESKEKTSISLLFLIIGLYSFFFLCVFIVSTAGTPCWNFVGHKKVLFLLIAIYLLMVFIFHYICCVDHPAPPISPDKKFSITESNSSKKSKIEQADTRDSVQQAFRDGFQ